jgi:hypothetical protein
MHSGCPDQRHVQHDRLLTMRARLPRHSLVLAVILLVATALLTVGAMLVLASAARADSVTVTPSEALLYTLTQFRVDGITSGENDQVDVLFNNVLAGRADVNGDGSFSGSFNIPAAPINCGANTVTVNVTASGASVATATLTADCASITVSPALVGRQQLPPTFQVSPKSFPLSSGFQLTVDGTPQPFVTGAGGGLDFTGSPACGQHQVVLSQPFGEAVVSASQTVRVLCPRITLAPATITQRREPAQMTVTGTQFHGNQPIAVSVGGRTVGSGVTDPSGNFSLPVTVAGLGCGTQQMKASEQATGAGPAVALHASAPLAVTGCPVTRPTLTANPQVLEPGMLTHVTGTGFQPNRPVVLSWRLSNRTPLLSSMTVKARADGRIDTYFMAMLHDLGGARQLLAKQANTSVTANVVVDGGTMQPSVGGQLIFRR